MDIYAAVVQNRTKTTMRAGAALLHFALVAGLAHPGLASAQDLSGAQIRDGLEKLSALMAAEVPKTARWVLVESHGRRWAGIYSQGEDVFPTEGNAFLLGEKPGQEARILVVFTGAVVHVRPENAPSTNANSSAGNGLTMPRVFSSSWKDANVSKDVGAAVEWLKKSLKKPAAAAGPQVPEEIAAMMSANDPFAPRDENAMRRQTTLVWASLLQHTGHAAEAMSLAQLALGGADEKQRKAMLDGLFNRVASGAYQRAMTEFATHRDWAKLRDEVEALVKRFPLGWRQRDAARVTLHHLTERAKLPADPPLRTAKPLAEADQKVLTAWLKEIETGKQPGHSRWTLPPAPGEAGEEEAPTRRAGNETEFPKSHGLAAVPLLAALLTDDTLTAAGTMPQGGFHYSQSYFSRGGGSMDAAQRLRTSYNSLLKPRSRSELAWQVLQVVLPQDMRRSDEEDNAAKAAEVMSWYASVKDTAPADLAIAYLESGENDADVIAHAIMVTDPKKFARLEALMLEQGNAWNPAELMPFVAKLGPEKGAAFIAKLRTKLEAEMERFGEGRGSAAKQMEAGLKRLEAAAKGEKKPTMDLPAVLKVLAAGSQNAEEEDQFELREAYEQLPKLLGKMTEEERVKAILPTLPGFKSSRMAAHLLMYALDNSANASTDAGEAKKPTDPKKLLAETKPHWEKLLGVKATAEDDGHGEPMALLSQTVLSLQQLARGKMETNAVAYLGQLGDRGAALLRENATALLEGKDPAALPVPSSITEEQRRKALEEWGKKSPEEIENGIQTMEILPLMTLNEALSRETELPDNLKAHAWRILTIEAPGASAGVDWTTWRGKLVDKDGAATLAKQVSALTTPTITSVNLRRTAPVLGWKLTVTEMKEPKLDWASSTLKSVAEQIGEPLPKLARRVCAAYLQSGRRPTQWTWCDAPITDGKEPPKDAKKPEIEDEELAEAREALAEMRETEKKSWEIIHQVLDEKKIAPMALFIGSASAETLSKIEEN